MIHDDVQMLADRMNEALQGKSLSDLELQQMREMTEQVSPNEKTPVHKVENLFIDAGTHNIPIRLYRPNAKKDLPSLIWFHGGGFVLGSLETGDTVCRQLANNLQAVVMNVDYRLAPEFPFPAGLEDCIDAYKWAAQTTPQSGGFDGSRLAVAGDSAGGSLAMALSIYIRENNLPMPQCQVSVYGAGDNTVSNPELGNLPFLRVADVAWFWEQYLENPLDLMNPYVSPNNVRSVTGLPPLFMITAEHDPTRDAAENYASRHVEKGDGSKIYRYPGMYHGFFGRPQMFSESAQAHHDFVEFVNEHLHANTQ